MTSTQFSPDSGSAGAHDADEIPIAWIRSSSWAYATATCRDAVCPAGSDVDRHDALRGKPAIAPAAL
jgi:hypothetical protein